MENLDYSIYSEESEAEEDFQFDRESSSRQSFSEKRKQGMSPPAKIYEYRQATQRQKKNGKFKSFIDLVI